MGIVGNPPFSIASPGEPAGKFREPDVLHLTAEQDARAGEEFTEAAEIVAEVVSPDDPDRDYVTKRLDYAAGGVPEYWIVDYAARQVTVLRLDPATGHYAENTASSGRGSKRRRSA